MKKTNRHVVGFQHTMANFKIVLDVSKIRNSCKFVCGYKIADLDRENVLTLVLSPQFLPGNYIYIYTLFHTKYASLYMILQFCSNGIFQIINLSQ